MMIRFCAWTTSPIMDQVWRRSLKTHTVREMTMLVTVEQFLAPLLEHRPTVSKKSLLEAPRGLHLLARGSLKYLSEDNGKRTGKLGTKNSFACIVALNSLNWLGISRGSMQPKAKSLKRSATPANQRQGGNFSQSCRRKATSTTTPRCYEKARERSSQ